MRVSPYQLSLPVESSGQSLIPAADIGIANVFRHPGAAEFVGDIILFHLRGRRQRGLHVPNLLPNLTNIPHHVLNFTITLPVVERAGPINDFPQLRKQESPRSQQSHQSVQRTMIAPNISHLPLGIIDDFSHERLLLRKQLQIFQPCHITSPIPSANQCRRFANSGLPKPTPSLKIWIPTVHGKRPAVLPLFLSALHNPIFAQ